MFGKVDRGEIAFAYFSISFEELMESFPLHDFDESALPSLDLFIIHIARHKLELYGIGALEDQLEAILFRAVIILNDIVHRIFIDARCDLEVRVGVCNTIRIDCKDGFLRI